MKTLKIEDLRRELIHILTEGYDCTAHRAETVLHEIEDRLETKGLVFDWDAALKDANPLITLGLGPQKTLRDEFAMEAMGAIIGKRYLLDASSPDAADDFARRVAGGAYRYADAMLKAREGK